MVPTTDNIASHLRSLSLRTGVSATPVLASMLDSLVRVSRRGEEKHFVKTGRGHGRCRHRYSPEHPRAQGPPYPAARIPRAPPDPGNSGAQPKPRRAKGERLTARHCFPSLPSQRFQALFNSLFKVLCIFPSRYLFAIGLPRVFSFRWSLPPT